MVDDEVLRLRADAEAAITRLDAERMPDEEVLRRASDRVRQRANDLIRQAKDPIRLGVVGEFGVGKSMLIGTLLGRPDLLPVEQRATTGNVTALYLVPGQRGTPTTLVDPPVVEFLSRPELSDCVTYVLDALVRKVRDVMPTADPGALVGYDPLAQGWERFEQWCRQYLWPTGGAIGGLEPRKIALELLSIRDAQLSADVVLGTEVTVPHNVVRAALDLGGPGGVPDTYPQRNLRPGLAVPDVKAGGDALSCCFPLIRRVCYYNVAVDPDCWALDGLRDRSGVVLLDFPGLTASRSAKRDEFLSHTELRTIHTIITVFGSAKPGNDIPHRFYGMLESHERTPAELRDSIIAVANAFDVVAVPDLPGDGPLTLDDVRAASQKFADFSHNASDLIQHRDDRIRLVSSVVAMDHYGYPASFPQQERSQLAEASAAATGRTAGWGAIGARMRACERDSPWAVAILAFAEDGGVASLRALIEDHARRHGLANKIRSLRRELRQLRTAVADLALLLPPEEVAEGEAEKGRVLLGQLFDACRQQHAALLEAVNQFRDPTSVRRGEDQVIERARARAMREVVAWPEWRRVIQRVESGLIPKNAPELGDDDDPFGGFGTVAVDSDDTTEVFFGQYRTVLERSVAQANEDLATSVREWVQQRSEAMAALRTDFEEPVHQDLLATGLERLRAVEGGTSDRLGALRLLVGLSWIVPRLDAVIRQTGKVETAEVEASFPLRRPAVLPWHVDIPENPAQPDQRYVRHQTYLLRVRRELANAVADAVGQRVAAGINEFRQALIVSLNRAYRFIPTPEQVRLMFPAEPSGSAGPAGGADSELPGEGSPIRSLLREWRARDAEPGV